MPSLKIGFIMDPINTIKYREDTSFAIMREAQARGHQVFYIEPHHLTIRNTALFACPLLRCQLDQEAGFTGITPIAEYALAELDVILIRKEPPFNMNYIYMTYLLELLPPHIVMMNHPQGIRNANEKLYSLNFPQYIPPTLVSQHAATIRQFLTQLQRPIIVKPLDERGGKGIDVITIDDDTAHERLESLTASGTRPVLAQQFLEANFTTGDKRILILNGEILGAFTRFPARHKWLANLSAGGRAERCDISDRDRAIVASLKPRLQADGLSFVGLDVIGGVITEMNVTSPAGIPEINQLTGTCLESQVLDFVEEELTHAEPH